MTRPLDGILVLDFTTLVPGPMATLFLAEAGADVVKIETPQGEGMRFYTPQWGSDSVNFALLNRGKKSVALDLKDPARRTQLDPLVKRADVLIEQFRPGVMARLGLDYARVKRANPRIVYCSLTGYGQDGPNRDVAAHDLNYISNAGLLSLSMGQPGHRSLPPALIADVAGGAYPAVLNILLALRERDTTGEGRHLDIAMAEGTFPFLYWAMGNGLAAGQWPMNGRERVTGGTPRYFIYETKDGRALAAAPLEQKFWDTFCAVIGLEEKFRDDNKDPDATKARVAEILAGETAAVWTQRFQAKDCCCCVVSSVREALNDPQFAARGVFARQVRARDGRTMPALPVPIASAFRGPEDEVKEAPELGAQNKEYLT